jgi:hypothetical protein
LASQAASVQSIGASCRAEVVAIRIVARVALALGLTQLSSAIVFGVKATDPRTHLAVVLGTSGHR